MIINSVSIDNYRSIQSTQIPLSNFSCIIGENNSGKSTTLLALSLLINGTKINADNYYNPLEPITIEAEISITKNDRKKISAADVDVLNISEGTILEIIRHYDTDGKSSLCFKDNMPKDPLFSQDSIKSVLKGTKGNAIKEAIQGHLPEYESYFEDINTQRDVYRIISSLIESMDPSELEESLFQFSSAEQKILQKIFPTPIYIPAVKDVNDEVKTTESSTLGKLLSVLLETVKDDGQLSEITNAFDDLVILLNKSKDGNDGRLQGIKNIEDQVNAHLNSNFSNAKLEFMIEPPSLKQIFSNTQVFVDDGIKNNIESKGDGLKRAITFALLRTYVDLNKDKSKNENDGDIAYYGGDSIAESADEGDEFCGDFLFLYEEPELYLHPSAQKILFDVLSNISESHQVLVTTHSPIFFSSTSIGSFIKMKKRIVEGIIPYSEAISIDIGDINNKDIFKLICYENCEA
ncbi:MAG: ATP-binding protein, partial [Gammaproteobacteria bacterium]|nr:ATP-binding protein [Gammaproteobacteria bacterium]